MPCCIQWEEPGVFTLYRYYFPSEVVIGGKDQYVWAEAISSYRYFHNEWRIEKICDWTYEVSRQPVEWLKQVLKPDDMLYCDTIGNLLDEVIGEISSLSQR